LQIVARLPENKNKEIHKKRRVTVVLHSMWHQDMYSFLLRFVVDITISIFLIRNVYFKSIKLIDLVISLAISIDRYISVNIITWCNWY
jgi:hypothetical protein